MTAFQRAPILLISSFLILLPYGGFAQPEKPSFDCRKAQSPDERAICYDRHLAELDQLASTAYRLAIHYRGELGSFAEEAKKVAKESLESRHACGADRLCILDQQVSLIESLSDAGVGPPHSSSTVHVPSWVGSYRLTLFAARSQPLSKELPLRVGQCTITKIAEISANRSEDDPYIENHGYTDVRYANDGEQVSQVTYVSAIGESRIGDEVLLCLVSLPKNCPPGDDRGRVYSGTNLRTNGSWVLPDAIHMCGGA